MKKLLIAVLVLVVLIIGAVVILPMVIPTDTIKQQITAAAKKATGRDLTIGGDFKLSVLPRFELAAEDVAFANRPDSADPNMASLKELQVRLEVFPLLTGKVQVDSFVLVDPVISLDVDADGKPNWEFETAEASTAPADDKVSTDDGDAGSGGGLPDISLGTVRLENGQVTYRDARSGQTIALNSINMDVSLPDMQSPAAATGSLEWNGQTIDLNLDTGPLQQLTEGAPTAVKAGVKSAMVTLDFDGSITMAELLAVAGQIGLDVPSLRELAAWTGNPIEMQGDVLGPLNISGALNLQGPDIAFENAAIKIDQIEAKGNFKVNTGGARPKLAGNLDIAMLDLNPYLPPEDAAGDGAASGGSGGGSSEPEGWSEEPIDFSGLGAADVDFALTVGGILVREIKVGKSAVKLVLDDRLLAMDLAELNLYDGKGVGKVSINGRNEVPTIEESFELTGVEALPLLTDAADFERLEGKGDIKIAVTTKGNSQAELVRALNGNGAIEFVDGAIIGINLAQMVRNATGAFDQSDAQKTDFAELSGTFKITDGIVDNQDLSLLSPLIRVTGAGTVELPPRTVNYRVTPKAVASLEGQGGSSDVSGIAVPVIIEGPWSDVKYRPDLEAAVGDVLKDPGKALEKVEDAGKVLEGAKDALKSEDGKGLIEGVLGKDGEDNKIDPKKALKGLLGSD